MGSIATARTIIPMPPSQLRRCRHKLMDRGRYSSPERTVPPVVVSPEAASKYASVKLIGRYFQRGNPATAGSATQVSATSIKPSRVFSSRLKRRVDSHNRAPRTKVATADKMKDHSAGSSPQIAMIKGASMVTANTIMTMANTCATGRRVSFTKKKRSLETIFPQRRYDGDPSKRGSDGRQAARWYRDAR